MKTLIAIGGGSFQQGGTRHIDEYAIKRCGKTTPSIVFLPTASQDDQGYEKRFKQYYRSLGCDVQSLRLFHTKLSGEEIQDVLLQSDMIYLGGGNTKLLRDKFLDFGLDETLVRAYEQGIVICGYSAGANILFDYGYSDVLEDGEFSFIEGFHLGKGLFCPHYQKTERKKFDVEIDFSDIRKIGCSDGCAYIIEDTKKFFLQL